MLMVGEERKLKSVGFVLDYIRRDVECREDKNNTGQG